MDWVRTPASYSGRWYCSTKRRRRASGSSGSVRADPLDPRGVEREGRQVRLREVPVVVRFLLRPHHRRPVRRGIEQPRFLDERRAVPPRLHVAFDLEFDGALHVAERIEVLQLGLHAERRLPHGTDGHVRVAPQAPLFHVSVVHAQGHEYLAHAAEGLGRVRRRPQVRFGDDLDEGHATAVEVEVCRRGRRRARAERGGGRGRAQS